MRTHFTTAAKVLTGCLVALALFAGGYVAGQNKFGQPKTIIHMVILKWNPGVSDSDKQAALEGVKEMAAKIPGVKNIWIKAERLQPRDFSAAFASSFKIEPRLTPMPKARFTRLGNRNTHCFASKACRNKLQTHRVI